MPILLWPRDWGFRLVDADYLVKMGDRRIVPNKGVFTKIDVFAIGLFRIKIKST